MSDIRDTQIVFDTETGIYVELKLEDVHDDDEVETENAIFIDADGSDDDVMEFKEEQIKVEPGPNDNKTDILDLDPLDIDQEVGPDDFCADVDEDEETNSEPIKRENNEEDQIIDFKLESELDSQDNTENSFKKDIDLPDEIADIKVEVGDGTISAAGGFPNKGRKRKIADRSDLHTCDQCEYTGTKDALRYHRQAKHEGLRYSCDQCEYVATRLYSLNQHKQVQHAGKGLHIFLYCRHPAVGEKNYLR